VFVSVTTVFVGGGGVLFGFGVTAVIVMMSRLTVMVGGKFVMRRRRVMMFARGMLGLRHENLLS
jgi:hypothetical protein